MIVSRLSFGAMTFGKGVGPFATVSKVEEVTAQAMIGMSLDAGVSFPIFRPKRASGFHTFRHSAGSFLNEQTSNLKLAQRFLGHADINTTANIYTHTSSESERDGTNRN